TSCSHLSIARFGLGEPTDVTSIGSEAFQQRAPMRLHTEPLRLRQCVMEVGSKQMEGDPLLMHLLRSELVRKAPHHVHEHPAPPIPLFPGYPAQHYGSQKPDQRRVHLMDSL